MKEREFSKREKDKKRIITLVVLSCILAIFVIAILTLLIMSFINYIDANSSYHDSSIPAEIISLDDSEVVKLKGYVEDTVGSFDCPILLEYPPNILKVKRLTKEQKMEFAIKNTSLFTKLNCDSNTDICSYILYSDFNNKYKELFGEYNTSKEDINYCNNHWKYNLDDDAYYLYGIRDDSKTTNVKKIASFELAQKVGNMIELYEYVAYTNYNNLDEATSSFTPHKDLDIIITEDNYLENLNNMDLYRYVFMKDKDNNYIWVSLEYVNKE